MPRYLDPKSDLVFKKIFGHHPELLKSFLNAILPLPADCIIESLVYIPTESATEISAFKYSIVDVRCLDNHGRYFIVEMQIEWTKDFMQRMVYNAAATYVHQLKKGEPYRNLSPVYGVALINDTFEKSPDWFHHFQMAKAGDESSRLENIQLVLIELPKLKPTTLIERKLAILWLRFLKEIEDGTEKVDEAFLQVEPIKEALQLAQESAYTAEELISYNKSWDAVSTEKTLMLGKFAEGEAKGRQEGRQEGRKEGEVTLLTRLLKRRFPNEVTERHLYLINEADEETLSLWGEKLMDVKNIDEIFVDFLSKE
jgi:predicted transposase/invertase (TIGR01784 family)